MTGDHRKTYTALAGEGAPADEQRPSGTRPWARAACLCGIVVAVVVVLMGVMPPPRAGTAGGGGFGAWMAGRRAGGAIDAPRQRSSPAEKVLLELFVMSKCPDANFCEHYLDHVLDLVHPIVRVQTQYIQQQAEGGKIACKHGPEECAGNMAQLCVGQHTPPKHNYDWFFKFLLCSWDSGLPVESSDSVKTCLNKVGASWMTKEAVDACIAGPEGASLMAASAKAVADRAVVNSCTIAVEGAKLCVRDGGEWKECPGGSKADDFINAICTAYKAKTGRDADVCGEEARRARGRAAGP